MADVWSMAWGARFFLDAVEAVVCADQSYSMGMIYACRGDLQPQIPFKTPTWAKSQSAWHTGRRFGPKTRYDLPQRHKASGLPEVGGFAGSHLRNYCKL